MLEHVTAMMVRTFARAGYEWLWIDNEHGHQSYETIYHAARTAEGVGIASIVRVTPDDYRRIAQAPDMGGTGIIVPRVETPEQVRHINDCAMYPPVGKRGFGMRASLFGEHKINMRDRAADQQDTRFLAIQLESPRGVENLEKIIEVAEGQLDGIFMVNGLSDGDWEAGLSDDPEVVARRGILQRVGQAQLSNGTRRRRSRRRSIGSSGFNMITYKSDEQFLADAA